jgi:hypothetical protein
MNQKPPRILYMACALTLVSLALIGWGIVDPVPLAVIFAMSLGQGIGTIGALLFGWVVLRDLRRAMRDAPKKAD